MKLKDLKVGMVVRLRNNDTYVIRSTFDGDYIIMVLGDSHNEITRVNSFCDDLTNKYSPNLDIMEVENFNAFRGRETIWKRVESNDDAQDGWEYFRKGLLKKHIINTKKEEKGMKALYNLIDKIYFNESKRTTTIKFKNGDISKATATVGTEFCEHAGFMAALFKYQYGKVKDLETFIKRKGERQ